MPVPANELIDFSDYDYGRQSIFNAVKSTLETRPALENDRYRLELSGLQYAGKPYGLEDQRKAILANKDLSWQLKGTWTLRNKADGKAVDVASGVVAHVPYMTPRGTFIQNGSEYTVVKQSRLKPGVYTRRKESGELESHVNVQPGTGRSFRVMLEPGTGKFRLLVGQSALPLASVLRRMGVSPATLKEAWGDKLYSMNERDDPKIDDKLFRHFGAGKVKPLDMGEFLRKTFDAMRLDPAVNADTMKLPDMDRMGSDRLLSITKRLLSVSRNEEEVDDRDSMAYQTLHGVDDFLKERLEKDAGGVMRRILWKASGKGSLKNLVGIGELDPHIRGVFHSSFANALEEINPIEILDQNYRVTRLGPGGIPDAEAIPDEAREVQATQFSFIDPIKAPESTKVGVDFRIAHKTFRHGKQLVSQFKDRTGQNVYLTPEEAVKQTIAFPGELDNTDKTLIRVMQAGRMRVVPRSQVQLSASDSESLFSPLSNLVPMLSSSKGHRLLMGSKMMAQALALRDPEAPLVRSASPDGEFDSFEDLYSKFAGAVRSTAPGRVIKVTPTEIVLKDAGGENKRYELYRDFPLNRKSFLHNTPAVRVGDTVLPGQLLASSNYTDDKGALALGKNLRVAYTNYEGKNYEDAIVISESAAKKMSSEHMYQHSMDASDEVEFGKKPFISIYPGQFTRNQTDKLDDTGVVRPGTAVRSGDPLILALGKPTQRASSAVHRSQHLTPLDKTVKWEGVDDGLVTDVVPTREGGWNVVVKSYVPTKVGDKFSGTYGNKGVISEIVPDDQMLKDSEGNTIDIVMNPLGSISRVNPSQIHAALLGKVAAKTGKPFKIRGFTPNSNVDFVEEQLKSTGTKPNEDLLDPKRNRKIKNVMTGMAYILKLHHTSEDKESGRAATGDPDTLYTSDQLPAKGGVTGSKRLSVQDINALLSHGARDVVRDAHLIKGQRNDAYWKMLRMGESPATPSGGFVHDKFMNMLQAAGVNVAKRGNALHLMALTDKDIEHLSHGAIKTPTTVDRRTLEPDSGGLFDVKLTGGHDGRNWTHIDLSEPMPNPVMEDPIRHLLKMTKAELEDVIAGEKLLPTGSGPMALKRALDRMDVDREIASARADVTSGRVTKRDQGLKRLGYLMMMKKTGLTPGDMIWTKVPVLPPAFRPTMHLPDNKGIVSADANELYADAFRANDVLGRTHGKVDESQMGDERRNLYRAMKAVVGLGDPVGTKSTEKKMGGILSHLFGSSPKYGLVQRSLISKPQDAVGRAVITPDPSLDLDQVGVPENMAWSVYNPFIIRRLVRDGASSYDAMRMAVNRDDLARRALLDEMKHRPMIINRAPTLHRFSVQAFWPVLTKGSTMRIAPLVTPGFNADFDGDAMQGFVPVSEEARTEAIEKMLPSRNLLDSTRFEVHLMPRQEYLQGLAMATGDIGQPSKSQPRVFQSARDVILAYRRGEIGIRDPVRIRS